MARKEIEVQFGLIKAQCKPKRDLDLQKVDKAVYGKSETRRTIANIVGMVMRTYNCTSLIEFNTVLRQFNVMADRGKEGTTMYQKNGLLYWILANIDETLQKIKAAGGEACLIAGLFVF